MKTIPSIKLKNQRANEIAASVFIQKPKGSSQVSVLVFVAAALLFLTGLVFFQLAVDGNQGKYPEFKGNVATVYAKPLSKGGNSSNYYNNNAETYMDVGVAMGRAMVNLLNQ